MELFMNGAKKYMKEKFAIGKSMEKASYHFIKFNFVLFQKRSLYGYSGEKQYEG